MTQAVVASGKLKVTADTGDPCVECGKPLDQHADLHPYHVDGYVVGNAACAQRLHTRTHTVVIVDAAKACGCLLADDCECHSLPYGSRLAATPITIRIGATRCPP